MKDQHEFGKLESPPRALPCQFYLWKEAAILAATQEHIQYIRLLCFEWYRQYQQVDKVLDIRNKDQKDGELKEQTKKRSK